MKRTLLLMICICLLTHAQAQIEHNENKVRFGIKAGPLLESFFSGFLRHQVSYQIGTTARMKWNKKSDFQLELLYSNLKTDTFKNYYLQLPVLYKREVFLDMCIELGAQVDFNIYNNLDTDVVRPVTLAYCLGFAKQIGGESYINFRYSSNLSPIVKIPSYKYSIWALTFVHEI